MTDKPEQCSPACSEQHTYTPPCQLATPGAARTTTSDGVSTGPERPADPGPSCATCGHPKRDHDGRADHRERYSPLVAGDPWCHACNAPCDYAPCVHPAGYEGECPCKPSCGCCSVTAVAPAPEPGLRERRARYAAAIHRYDYEHGLSGNDIPSEHHRGEADAVLNVRDAELEQLREQVAELEAARATLHELELRQRRAWNAAGHCPMCNTSDTDGWLCDDCAAAVRRLPARDRRQWRRYEPPATGTPIQSHGYTPAGLLGITEPEPPALDQPQE